MAMIQARGFNFNVEVVKKKAKRNTLFLHGNLASNTWWRPSLEAWQEAGEGDLFLMEWRGCGSSQAPTTIKEIEISELARDVVAVVEQLSKDSVDLIGHSTGGLIGLMAVLNKPEMFEKIVLLDSVGPKGVALQPELLGAFDLMRTNKEVCAQVMAGTIKGVDTQSDIFKKIVDDAFSVAEVNWKGIPQNLTKVDITDKLQTIYHEVLVLHGENDEILPLEDSRFMAESLPNAKFNILKGHGHSLNVEDPKAFNKLLNSFL